jgi:hypothetical protein
MTSLQAFVQDKKYIFWWVWDCSKLSDEAIIEWIIKYGKWEDLIKIINSNSEKFSQDYKKIISKKRCNLNLKEINFINKILENV